MCDTGCPSRLAVATANLRQAMAESRAVAARTRDAREGAGRFSSSYLSLAYTECICRLVASFSDCKPCQPNTCDTGCTSRRECADAAAVALDDLREQGSANWEALEGGSTPTRDTMEGVPSSSYLSSPDCDCIGRSAYAVRHVFLRFCSVIGKFGRICTVIGKIDALNSITL